ncbi:helix-turn-helix transcriptional regulator [Mycolicibacterium goodii]|uniref:helix-turn-helix domain-containing protein n=1 Tax=Mycolicibacterium goodii TaxID=134601 RepID=UPI001BDCAA9E|nr:helix-turn-helix transcriptional regulator [Mycolicibacterium goodii]MBU8820476.1 helix-turn-helix transcriptional regulator [Mycolicibacterium goodii]
MSSERVIDTENATRYDFPHDARAVEQPPLALTFKDAGDALRRLRTRRGWTLDEMAAMTGLAKMSISRVERATKVPRPSTIARLENGLGWKPGSFYRLAEAGDDDAALDELVDSFTGGSNEVPSVLPVRKIKGSEVLVAHVEATIDMVDALIDQLPPSGSPRFLSTVNAALAQCARVTVLTATSWRMSPPTDQKTATRLLKSVHDLEAKRRLLLKQIPDSVAARFDSACSKSGLPDGLISVLTGLTTDEMWSVRSGGAVPEGANARVAAFIKSQLG